VAGTMPYIVDADGRCAFGRYTLPFANANIKDGYLEDYASWLRQPTRWNAWLRSLRLKEWHFVSINHSDIFVAFAVVQLGYISNLFAYVVDKRSGRIHEWGERVPLGRSLRFGDSSVQGKTIWQNRNSRVVIDNQTGGWDIELKLDNLSAKFHMVRDEAMALVFPLAKTRAGYTHKEAGNTVEGHLKFQGEDFELTPENCLGVSDWSRSFSNHVTKWNYAAFAGRHEGTRLGLNLSQLIYDDDTGASQENTVWVDGRSHQVGAARFVLPKNKELDRNAWRIVAVDPKNTAAQSVDLTFEPMGVRREHLSLGLLASKFTQAFGYYSGTLTVNSHSYRIDRVFGVAEKHYSKW
jgi:hypothetical protein